MGQSKWIESGRLRPHAEAEAKCEISVQFFNVFLYKGLGSYK